MTRMELIDWLEKEIAAFPGKTSLLMMDLLRGVELVNLNGDAQVSAASTIKMPILMATLDLAAQNKLSLDRMVPIGTVLEDTRVFEPENYQSEYTLMELLEWMIVNSDNTATNAVIDVVGKLRLQLGNIKHMRLRVNKVRIRCFHLPWANRPVLHIVKNCLIRLHIRGLCAHFHRHVTNGHSLRNAQ